jgi:hypothetical protein
MKIEVRRDPADKKGPKIVDATLVTPIAAIARGTREIDYHSTNRMMERGNCPLHGYMETGSLVNVTNDEGSYRGKLKMYAFTIDISEDGRDFSCTSSVTIEREM